MSLHAPSRLTIDTEALKANYRFLCDKLTDGAKAAGVVKANAYGCGVDVVVPALADASAKFFYVAQFAEALDVRKYTDAPIAVLGGLADGAADDYKRHKIIPVLNSPDDIANCPADLPAIWHIDTGMNRLGLNCDEVADAIPRAKALPFLLMTHFTSSDDAASDFTAEQVRRFDACIAGLPKPFTLIPQSICNSSGIFRSPHPNLPPQGGKAFYSPSPLTGEGQGGGERGWHRQQVRPGLALYGANPTPEAANPMQPVVTLETKILQTRTVKAGETAGYNQTYTFPTDTVCATVGLGYADGFFRTGSNRAKLYWRGPFGPVACPIVGRVSMDLIIVDIGHIKGPMPRQGQWLEVIGPNQSVDALADDLGTISYEVLTSLSHRAERIIR